MEMRKFQNIGRDVSLLGFGCMRLPKICPDKMDIDWDKAHQMVDYAYKNGINYFDTAYIYHNGESEPCMGEALKKYPRESFMLADKMPIWLVKTEEDVERIFLDQLDKCKVEYFDFYLLHALDKKSWKKAEKFGVYDKLKKYKEQGKIKRLGFSFHDGPAVLEEIASAKEWDFAQIQLNYIDWEDIDSKAQYEVLAKKNIPVIIMEPLKGGNLVNLTPDSEKLLRRREPNMSNASWALRFAMSLGNVLTVLSGMSDMSQLEDNIKTVSKFRPLSEEDLATVHKVATLHRSSGAIPCTSCKYCIDCPKGVNISSIFSIYNAYTATKNIINFAYCYKSLSESEQADQCIACGKCEAVCPQHIEIIEELKKIDGEIKAIKPR